MRAVRLHFMGSAVGSPQYAASLGHTSLLRHHVCSAADVHGCREVQELQILSACSFVTPWTPQHWAKFWQAVPAR